MFGDMNFTGRKPVLLTEPKVDKEDSLAVLLPTDHEIGRFDVSMDEVGVMKILNSLKPLLCNFKCSLHGEDHAYLFLKFVN
jgi:hypothetical protein